MTPGLPNYTQDLNQYLFKAGTITARKSGPLGSKHKHYSNFMGSTKIAKHKKKQSTPKYIESRSPQDAEGYESETEDDKKPLIDKKK